MAGGMLVVCLDARMPIAIRVAAPFAPSQAAYAAPHDTASLGQTSGGFGEQGNTAITVRSILSHMICLHFLR